MSGVETLHLAAQTAIGLLLVALLLAVVGLVRGPTLADRILALDLMTTLAVGLIAAITVLTGFALYIDVAIAVSLAGFLSTVALARYLVSRGNQSKDEDK